MNYMRTHTRRPRGPLCWLDPGAYGTLGCGAGFALGAKLCRPDHDVWVVFGDGSLGYSLPEFDTFARHKLPLVAVVGTDACWAQINRDQKRLLKSEVGCTLAVRSLSSCTSIIVLHLSTRAGSLESARTL